MERPADLEFARFWDLREFVSGDPATPAFEAAASELAELLRDAVRLRCSGRVQMGCLLSGGLDTSTVAARSPAPTPSSSTIRP